MSTEGSLEPLLGDGYLAMDRNKRSICGEVIMETEESELSVPSDELEGPTEDLDLSINESSPPHSEEEYKKSEKALKKVSKKQARIKNRS